MATAKAQDPFETPEMSSSSSDKESSSPAESPSGGSKEDGDEMAFSDMPSASSKGESLTPIESPSRASKDGEIDILEMPSSSSKEECSTPIESPPVTSKEDGDEIDILSSKTESPPMISTDDSTISQETSGFKCSSYICCDAFFTWCESFMCIRKKRANCYNCPLLFIAFLGILLSCFILRTHAVGVYWEFLYGSLLIMYCSLLSCCFERGCWAKTPPPIFPKRKKVSSPAKVAEEEESTKDAVPAAIQTDTPEHEREVVIIVSGDPGTSASRV